jgi:4-amino-4-deoxy-L-arabinose transferase-like glycosyltransferase
MAAPRGRRDLLLFAAVLVLFAAALVRQLAVDAPLGPDEAIYATGGREITHGVPPSAYGLHRPVGMKWLAAPGVAAGGSEAALRVIGVLCSLGFLVAYRAFGARVAGPWPAAWAAAAMATSFGLMRRGGELLSDVPSLLLLVLVLHLLVRELDRPSSARPGPVLLAIAPLAAAAFYLRYGVTSALAGAVGAAGAMWWRALAEGWRVALASAALFVLLLLPHVLHSLGETGSALGILEVSGDAAHRAYLGDGLVHFPLALVAEGGPIVTALLIAGLVHGARRLRARREPAVAFVWLASVFQIVATGLLVHAEFRYFFFGVVGLVLLGARAACQWAAGRRGAGPVAAALVLIAFVVTHEVNVRRYRRLAAVRQVEVEAGLVVAREAGEGSCSALTSEVPAVGWYSGCTARPLHTRPDRLPTDRRFLVLFARDPASAAAAERLARTHTLVPAGRVRDAAGKFGDAHVFEIRPRAPLEKPASRAR